MQSWILPPKPHLITFNNCEGSDTYKDFSDHNGEKVVFV